jgi:hypothetical protein
MPRWSLPTDWMPVRAAGWPGRLDDGGVQARSGGWVLVMSMPANLAARSRSRYWASAALLWLAGAYIVY